MGVTVHTPPGSDLRNWTMARRSNGIAGRAGGWKSSQVTGSKGGTPGSACENMPLGAWDQPPHSLPCPSGEGQENVGGRGQGPRSQGS